MKPSLKSVVSGNTNKGFESILHHRMEHSAVEKFGLEVHKTSSVVDWKPSPVVALATSLDESQVAVAREDCSVEIWLVSPGSVGWHCLLTIHGKDNSRISSLVWCRSRSKKSSSGRLLSSSIDGSILEWDLFSLKQKVLLDSIGVSIWQMAIEPFEDSLHSTKHNTSVANHRVSTHDDDETSGSDDDFVELHSVSDHNEHQRIAIGCDDGCVRLYAGSDDEDVLVCTRSLPRVNGRILSVAWSPDATRIYSGSSDGFIRCWDAASAREFYRIQVGRGGTGSGQELCVWSLLALRCGTLVSADSSGSVQFWDGRHGTLVQAHAYHKGDANALAAAPSHKRVFSAGSDGQVILYKLSSDLVESGKNESTQGIEKWVYVGYMRAHTHDVRALTVAVPISREDPLPNEKKSTSRGPRKPIDFGYRKWAHLGVPMLISGGDDSKLFAYSAKDFTKFSPHDICPAPQRVPVQLVLCTKINGASVMLVQYPSWLDVLPLHVGGDAKPGKRKHMGSERSATAQLLARVKCKASRKIICSTISGTGVLIAYSDHLKPSLFELTRLGGSETGKTGWAVDKRRLPHKLPFAHSMAFSSDSSRLMIAGYDRKIYVVDVESEELLHTFELSRREHDTDSLTPTEPPITRMCTSSDGQWLAAINCYGDIYIFSLETYRQHWFISRLNGACVTAGGFPPSNSNVLIITTSTNQVYAFDVDARELGEWSKHHTFVLPRSFQEFPGEVIGITFPPAIKSTQAIIYSSRAMCWIDFGNPVEQVKDDLPNGVGPTSKKLVVCENGERKCKKLPGLSCKLRENFQFFSFRDPALFVGYLSQKSILVIEKPWMEVVKTFEAPVHRHIFGI